MLRADFNAGYDTTAADTALIQRNQAFLNQIAPLEPIAAALQAQGRPQLNQSLQAWKQDSVNAIGIVQKMIQDRRATVANMQHIAAQSHKDTLDTLLKMNEAQRIGFGLVPRK